MLFVRIWFMVMKKRTVMLLTEPLFFDTDCISAFLWINNQSLLAQLYPGRVVIPSAVYEELSNPGVSYLKKRIDVMIADKSAQVEDIQLHTAEYDIYRKLTISPDPGHVIIGKGEAAAIALAKEKNGILASNNLRDILTYVSEYELLHMTTGDILLEAYDKKMIKEDEGNALWQEMLRKRRRLGYKTFSEYLKNHVNT